ncbi:peptidylprolyl isomerase [Desulforegula conservatrix]|uniref:peptidylprolyl isomerase n=1 Tax=Desulforegula conservatrix TaxID=153026 RepID=UPI0003F7A6B8|nr:SurA N-terminal domain-containing protein [Desulforegula conservatrix]
MTKKSFRVSAVFTIITISALACMLLDRSVLNAQTTVVDRIVAIVNQDIITLSELTKATAPYEKMVKEKKYPSEQEQQLVFKIRKDAIERLVEKALTDQEVKKYGITVSDKELDSSVERFKEQGALNDEDFRKALAREGMTPEGFREETRGRILRSKLVNAMVKSKIVITEEDIKKYHEKTTGTKDDGKMHHLFHILKSYENKTDSAGGISPKEEMDQILSRLKNGEDFSVVAKLTSESPTAESGGDLGLFNIGDLSTEIKGAVEKLSPGEFSDVVQTSQGYQIFFLKEIVDAQSKSYTDSSSEIEEKLYNEIIEEKFKTWLDGLKEKSYIKIIN